MRKNIEEIISGSIEKIIKNTTNDKKINEILGKHNNKLHFIPKPYRILSGILQSMNIQFGDFIEILIKNLIENEGKYEIIEKYSGKKKNKFKILKKVENHIDEYITISQTLNGKDLDRRFSELKNIIFNVISEEYIYLNHDIDLLFKDKKSNIVYYIEIKYNDDHDSGKFIDINRKFIKTYAYLLEELGNKETIIPILYYFTDKKRLNNIFIPENTNIMRGKEFFEKFLSIDYEVIKIYLEKISESKENKEMFNKMYENIISKIIIK